MRGSGHTLRDEGAAFVPGHPPNQRYPIRSVWNGTGGKGFGLCSCGARSGVLNTGQERKDWHRDHKRKVVGR